MAGIAKIIGEATLGEAGAGCGFDGDYAGVALALDLASQVGHGQAGEVGAAAGAAQDDVGLVAGHRHLLDGLLADDGLVEEDVIQYAAQGVFGIGILGGHFDGFGDGDSKRPVGVGMLGQNGAAGVGLRAGAGGDGGAEGFHQGAAIGLLVIADADHVDLALEAEKGAGHGECRTPLAGAGLSGEPLGAFHLVVIGLRDGGIGLVRAGGADALVFVIDMGGRIESLLQTAGAKERRGTPLRIDLAHGAGNLDFALGADLLKDKRHGKQRGQIVGADGLVRAGMQGRRHGLGQVGGNVVPRDGNATIAANYIGWFPCGNCISEALDLPVKPNSEAGKDLE